MTADLVAFLRARLNDSHAALIRYRDGHDGPCLNMPGQRPEDYDEYGPCYLHIETAEATAYRDVAFGLADIDAKRQLIALHQEKQEQGYGSDFCVECGFGEVSQSYYPCGTLRLLALPYAGHPDYREEWRP